MTFGSADYFWTCISKELLKCALLFNGALLNKEIYCATSVARFQNEMTRNKTWFMLVIQKQRSTQKNDSYKTVLLVNQ